LALAPVEDEHVDLVGRAGLALQAVRFGAGLGEGGAGILRVMDLDQAAAEEEARQDCRDRADSLHARPLRGQLAARSITREPARGFRPGVAAPPGVSYHDKPFMDKSLQSDDIEARDTWRIFRIMAELVDGFETLSRLPRGVTVFGSARTRPGQPDYAQAEEIGRALAQAGYTVITGGGPGDMEAAHTGALHAGRPT